MIKFTISIQQWNKVATTELEILIDVKQERQWVLRIWIYLIGKKFIS